MTQQLTPNDSRQPKVLALPRMTYEEFLEWDFDDRHVEWVDGEVVMMAPVSGGHSDLGVFLLRVIAEFVEINRLGVVRNEPFNMKTGPDLPGRSPDILFVANRNVARLKRTHLKGPADLVVEIVSPSTGGVDRGDKYYEYERGGVKEYWLVEPEAKRAEFYRLPANKRYQTIATKDGIFRSVVLKGLWLKVQWLWEQPLPPVRSVVKQWGLE